MAAEPIEAGKESVCEHARCTLPRASCRCIATSTLYPWSLWLDAVAVIHGVAPLTTSR
jgi:hypothetical protein